jgi:hypothetical protein
MHNRLDGLSKIGNICISSIGGGNGGDGNDIKGTGVLGVGKRQKKV